ncbi:nucleotide-binding protein [Spirillospora sp. NBC_01491]|uniref:nucleotide-binding protein n=1 Tax=Spirillospora sp. NBC_01491 TaxID=2976007 RepID=UPI002E320852|nr:AAA family ATPase [Spirillospora sp. NBC_01491]
MTPPPFDGGQAAQQQQYEGGPMPQSFDGGMLPPPYAGGGYQPYDPGQMPSYEGGGPAPQQPPYEGVPQPQPPYEGGPAPQQPSFDQQQPWETGPAPQQPYDASGGGQGAPPLDQLPPYPSEQYAPQDPAQGAQPYPYGPVDPAQSPPAGGHYNPVPGFGPEEQQPAGGHYNPVPGFGPEEQQPAEGYAQPAGYPQMPPGAPQGPYPGQPGPAGYPGQAGHPGPGQPGYPQGNEAPPPGSSESLSSENLLGERRIAPSAGWRKAVYKASGGNIHPGESQNELRRKDLIGRARTTVAGGHHRVAVMSLKGGVGKTTTTTGLGAMLSSIRGDRVIAVDANPDRGTLSDKVKLETAATVRDLLNDRDRVHRYADVRAFTSQNGARLEVLASDRDPAVSEAFSAKDYAAVAVVLEQFYSICITDCGTGLLHSAMAGVLSLADQLVLVSSPSVDGARSASATLDWLEAHDHGHLVRNGVVVLSMVRNRTRSQVDLDKLQAHFESRCRAVVRIPYDDHLEEGAEVELEQLAPATREAYLNLAAVVGDGFAFQRPPA